MFTGQTWEWSGPGSSVILPSFRKSILSLPRLVFLYEVRVQANSVYAVKDVSCMNRQRWNHCRWNVNLCCLMQNRKKTDEAAVWDGNNSVRGDLFSPLSLPRCCSPLICSLSVYMLSKCMSPPAACASPVSVKSHHMSPSHARWTLMMEDSKEGWDNRCLLIVEEYNKEQLYNIRGAKKALRASGWVISRDLNFIIVLGSDAEMQFGKHAVRWDLTPPLTCAPAPRSLISYSVHPFFPSSPRHLPVCSLSHLANLSPVWERLASCLCPSALTNRKNDSTCCNKTPRNFLKDSVHTIRSVHSVSRVQNDPHHTGLLIQVST